MIESKHLLAICGPAKCGLLALAPYNGLKIFRKNAQTCLIFFQMSNRMNFLILNSCYLHSQLMLNN